AGEVIESSADAPIAPETVAPESPVNVLPIGRDVVVPMEHEFVTPIAYEVVAPFVEAAIASAVDETSRYAGGEAFQSAADDDTAETADDDIVIAADDVSESHEPELNAPVDEVVTVTVDARESLAPILPAIPAASDAPPGIVNFAIEQEFNLSLAAAPLDGFTADEEPPVADDSLVTEDVGIVMDDDVSNVVHAIESGVLPSLDFDAMLEFAQPDVTPVADLQAEEFTTGNDELVASRFVRTEDDSVSELVDEFESSAQLPPLIFPMPSNFGARDQENEAVVVNEYSDATTPEYLDAFSIENVDPIANEYPDLIELDLSETTFDIGEISELSVPIDFRDFDAFNTVDEIADVTDAVAAAHTNAVTDIVFLDIPDVDAPALTPISLEVLDAPRAAGDIGFDLLDDSIESNADTFNLLNTLDASDIGLELMADNADALLLPPDDLDDLFGDADVPTAIVAAEATLVASSRCSELRTASHAEPENFVLRRRLGEALLEAGDRDEAIAELGAALAGAELANALADAADIADELVHVAGDEIAHHQKRLELAIRLGDQSRLRDAYLDLADNLVRRGEDLRAKAVYARVLEIDPWDDRARTALGDSAPPPPPPPAKQAAANSDEGHVSLADWLRDDDAPVSTRLRMREPDISGDEQDDFNALLKHFKEGVARSLGEDDYESHYDLGVAYKEMGLLDDAIGEFQMALRSRSNRLAAYEALGQCFIEQQSYKVAVTVLSRALHEPAIQDEQRVGVLYLLGISCEVLQRFDEARSYFQRVYATDIHFRDVGQRLADLERSVR
ncbi:MAG: tetratricopeptide repeat protein, partial [Gemmatimonas sp.]